MRNLIFVCMRAQVQVREQVSTSVQQRDELDTRINEQVREQVSTSVQQRDELDSRINVIFYHLFVWTCDCLSLIEVVCNMYTYV
ncbi:hypothetical protein HanXRQr2_Chr16g0760881 [Helianthus annuus]|uniref:Uncharacterized protein n=1 Tax=Helianthus annuus TaxID=4232 RepID=A0A9K3GZ32_HELAN|nr:hypothetical protein HanXRQr2_Chr16g0760881 [Helianthus annuus]KAJ0822188.1 hypothetical protein HanPSC8_Chr16g0729071 [Helianthus annuus]